MSEIDPGIIPPEPPHAHLGGPYKDMPFHELPEPMQKRVLRLNARDEAAQEDPVEDF